MLIAVKQRVIQHEYNLVYSIIVRIGLGHHSQDEYGRRVDNGYELDQSVWFSNQRKMAIQWMKDKQPQRPLQGGEYTDWDYIDSKDLLSHNNIETEG